MRTLHGGRDARPTNFSCFTGGPQAHEELPSLYFLTNNSRKPTLWFESSLSYCCSWRCCRPAPTCRPRFLPTVRSPRSGRPTRPSFKLPKPVPPPGLSPGLSVVCQIPRALSPGAPRHRRPTAGSRDCWGSWGTGRVAAALPEHPGPAARTGGPPQGPLRHRPGLLQAG